MGNLKEVRERIGSVKNTKQITSAMKLVSAAKLRRAQQAIVDMRPYADKLDQMLRNILAALEGDAGTAFNQNRPLKNAALVVVTSNRGLAGAFNTNIIKSAVAMLQEVLSELPADGQVEVISIGKKANDFFRRNYSADKRLRLVNKHVALFDDLSFDATKVLSQYLMDGFENATFDRVLVSYSRFKNAAQQFSETQQFLPVLPPAKQENADKSQFKADYIFEPGKEALLNELVPSILQTTFQKYLLDTHASEHGARMTAMDKATENAEELLKELKISYNKARQEAITSEILEIVGGAAALEDV